MLETICFGLSKRHTNSAVYGVFIIESLSIVSGSEYDSSWFVET